MTTQVQVLIADDDAAMRAMLSASLRRKGFTVAEFSSGGALLEHIDAAPPAAEQPIIVVSDLQMPGLTGLDVLHALRPHMPHVAAILITAFGDPKTHKRAKELGAVTVLDKPFELGHLHGLVDDVAKAWPCSE